MTSLPTNCGALIFGGDPQNDISFLSNQLFMRLSLNLFKKKKQRDQGNIVINFFFIIFLNVIMGNLLR
jgi:hypothetical protein